MKCICGYERLREWETENNTFILDDDWQSAKRSLLRHKFEGLEREFNYLQEKSKIRPLQE